MPVIIDGTNGLTFPDTSRQYNGYFGFKNRIINGDMRIDQRNNGASVTIPLNAITYVLDRWFGYANQASKFSIQRNAGAVTPPSGFTNYLGVTSLAATTPLSTEEFVVSQRIEGFNTADLAWGTASAQTVTLSFFVRSSLTGTFGGSVSNNAGNRSYVFSYTISAANTWEQKTLTIPGDTSGTWTTDNTSGVRLVFDMGSGSNFKGTAGVWGGSNLDGVTGGVNVVGTNGATFYVTGVQLEEGVVSTNFDVRPYGTELQLCQRYGLQMAVSGFDNFQYYAIGYLYNTTQGTYTTYLPVPMRTTPTITQSGTLTAANLGINISSLAAPSSQIGAILTGDFTLTSTTTSGNAAFIRFANVSTKSLFLSAEL